MQAPQWTDFLQCPICLQDFNDVLRLPVSLACGHTVCKSCLSNLQRRQCQFCSSPITTDIEKLPVNDALLLLTSGGSTLQPSPLPYDVLDDEKRDYLDAKRAIESLALLLKPLSILGTVGSTNNGTLSRPMQRKLVTLINCQLIEAEGRARAMRAARSLGERTVTELLLHHQNQQQLSSNLWAAVRQRGCQFLGPALQEECLRLILFSLEGGVQLSRKVLVKFVVSRLQEKEYHQASKTSVGHVVQLLYRASCFKVTKRDDESSLMELKEEFQSYEALRREHDSQIVQIAMEAGLRIAPDQWSSLLYGDTNHKSHMQSIIDKLQTPESFSHSIDELVIALTRSSDPFHLGDLRDHFEFLSNLNASSEILSVDWETCSKGMQAVEAVVQGLVRFVQANQKSKSSEFQQAYNSKYKTSMCKDMQTRGSCPRGATCSFAHSEDEMERFRRSSRNRGRPLPARVPGQPLQPPPVANMQSSLSHFSQSAGMSIAPPQSQFPSTFPGPHGPVHHISNYIPYAQSPQPATSQPMLQSLTPKQSVSRHYSQEMMTGMAVPPSGPYSTPPTARMGLHSYGQQHPGSNKSYSMPQMGGQYVRGGYPPASQFGGRPVDFHSSSHGSMDGLYSDVKHSNTIYRDQMTPRAPILVNRGAHSGGNGPPSFGHFSTEYSYYGRRPPGPSYASMSSGSFDGMPYGSGLSNSVSYGSDVDFGEYGSHQSFSDPHVGKPSLHQTHHEDTAYRPPSYSHQLLQSVTQSSIVRPVRPPQWSSRESYPSHESAIPSDQFGYGDMVYGAGNHQQGYGQQNADIQGEPQSSTSYRTFALKEESKPAASEYELKWSVNSGIDHSSGSASPESEYVTTYRSRQRQSVTMQPPEKETVLEQKLTTDPFNMPTSPASAYSFSPVVGTPTNMKSANVRERDVQSPSTSESNGSLFVDEKVRRKSPLASMWDDNGSSVSCLHKSPWSNDTEPTTSTTDTQWQPSVVANAWFNIGTQAETKKGTTGGSELDRKREELKHLEEELLKREAMLREKETALAKHERKISSPKPPDTSDDLEIVRNIQRQLNAEELMEKQSAAGSQLNDEQLAWDVQRLEIGGDDVSLSCGITDSALRRKSLPSAVYNSLPVKDVENDHEHESLWKDEATSESVKSTYDVAQKDITDLVPRTPARESTIQ